MHRRPGSALGGQMSKHLAEDDSENEGPSDYSPAGSWRSRSPSCSSAADSPSPEFRFSARPVSRLATDQGRIVIREEPERPNPTPATKLTGDVLLESLLEEHLSPEKLLQIANESSLEQVTFLQMRVNTLKLSLGNFGELIPNLVELKLTGSYISSLRDLGTSLRNLSVVWLSRCDIRDLDGISVLDNLKELYLAFNKIEDLSPLTTMEYLETLDVEENLISSMDSIEYLALVTSLNAISLQGNPFITSIFGSSQTAYRKAVARALPQLRMLDDCNVTDEDHEALTTGGMGSAARGAWSAEMRKEASQSQFTFGAGAAPISAFDSPFGEAKSQDSPPTFRRPSAGSAHSRAASGLARPEESGLDQDPFASRQTPKSDVGQRVSSASSRKLVNDDPLEIQRTASSTNGTALVRPRTGSPSLDPTEALLRELESPTRERQDQECAASDLTFGQQQPICGNPISVLRSRRGRGIRIKEGRSLSSELISMAPAPPSEPSESVVQKQMFESLQPAAFNRTDKLDVRIGRMAPPPAYDEHVAAAAVPAPPAPIADTPRRPRVSSDSRKYKKVVLTTGAAPSSYSIPGGSKCMQPPASMGAEAKFVSNGSMRTSSTLSAATILLQSKTVEILAPIQPSGSKRILPRIQRLGHESSETAQSAVPEMELVSAE